MRPVRSHTHKYPFSRRESLYESDELPRDARDLAALLVSKVYFYLGEYDEALSFALGAGRAFEAESRNPSSAEFVETVVCELIADFVRLGLTRRVSQPKPSTVTLASAARTRRRTSSTHACAT